MRKVVQTVLFTGLTLLAFSATSGDAIYSQIYKKQCATCHGNNGDGKGRAGASFSVPPTDFTSLQSKQVLSADGIKKAIRDGVAGTSMVAYGRRFDEKMLDGLSAFIQTAFMGRNLTGASNISSAEIPSKNIEDTSDNPGQAIYIANCSACHGDKGESAVWAVNGLIPPPRNFTTSKAREELSRERMITSVTYGRPGTAMMSFGKRLSKNEIELVVKFIRQNFMQQSSNVQQRGNTQQQKLVESSVPAVVASAQGNLPLPVTAQSHEISVDMQAAFPDNLTGDAVSGKVFYESNCFTCHGKKGDGEGPRSHFNYPRPRNFTSSESRMVFNRPRLFTSISHGKRGSVMPAWSSVLSKQEIANVAEYVFQQFIMTADAAELKKKP